MKFPSATQTRRGLPFAWSPDLKSLRVALVLIAMLLAIVCDQAFAATRPPNILFIFSDDHAYQAISAYGDSRKLNRTPNIDRLAKEGMIFHRALVPNSICGPSRACVLTGK